MSLQNNPICQPVTSTAFFFPFFLATFNETHHPPLPVSPLHSVPAVSRILSLVPVVSYLDTPKTAGVVLLSEVLCANIFHCILKVLNVILKKYINFNESYFIIYLHKIILHALLRSKFQKLSINVWSSAIQNIQSSLVFLLMSTSPQLTD